MGYLEARPALEDGEKCRQEFDLNAGDGFQAEEAVFYLCGELGVGSFVAGRGNELDVGDKAGELAGSV
jgi:hypothetical protein